MLKPRLGNNSATNPKFSQSTVVLWDEYFAAAVVVLVVLVEHKSGVEK